MVQIKTELDSGGLNARGHNLRKTELFYLKNAKGTFLGFGLYKQFRGHQGLLLTTILSKTGVVFNK